MVVTSQRNSGDSRISRRASQRSNLVGRRRQGICLEAVFAEPAHTSELGFGFTRVAGAGGWIGWLMEIPLLTIPTQTLVYFWK